MFTCQRAFSSVIRTIKAVKIYTDNYIHCSIYIHPNSIYNLYPYSSVYTSVGVHTYASQYLYIHSSICIPVVAFAYSSTATFTKCTLILKGEFLIILR